MMRAESFRRVIVLTGAVGALGVAAAGCGSSSASGPSSGGASTGATASACVQHATAAVNQARAVVQPPLPTIPVDMAKLRGKSVWLINIVDNQLTQPISAGLTNAANAAGLKPVVYNANGTVDQWNAGVSEAVAQNAGAIILLAINPALVATPLKEAVKKHIPIIDIFNVEPSAPLYPGLYAHVTPDFVHDGRVMADWMLVKSNCKANAAVFGAKVIQTHSDMMSAMTKEFQQQCPTDCKLNVQDIDISAVATKLGPQVANVVRSTPSLKYVVIVFDSAVTFVRPAISGYKVGILSHDGVDANLNLIRSGQQLVDVSFPPNEWIGWALVDEAARGMAGMPAYKWVVPTRLFDSTNIGTDNSGLWSSFNGFEAGFKKLWGVS